MVVSSVLSGRDSTAGVGLLHGQVEGGHSYKLVAKFEVTSVLSLVLADEACVCVLEDKI